MLAENDLVNVLAVSFLTLPNAPTGMKLVLKCYIFQYQFSSQRICIFQGIFDWRKKLLTK